MADHVELTEYIRYRLDALGARNGHHEFEDLCFHLAKAVVTPDLIYMTGPVSAGGDQGRDFETFRGQRGSEDISFACTIQQNGLVSKIRADVGRTVGAGRHVDAVVAMCASELAGSARHRLEQEMNDLHGIRLEVLDGLTIADKLAEPANFWIARRYLAIPESFVPTAVGGSQRYADARTRWLGRTDPIATYGELIDVQECAREVVFDDGPVADLEIWLEHLRAVADPAGDIIGRKAFYQLAALSLRGTESMHGLEPDLAVYFTRTNELEGEVDVEDLEVLLNYTAVAALTGRATIEPDLLASWRSALIARIDDLLAATENPGRRCALLMSLASAHLIATDSDNPFPDAAIGAAMDGWMALVAESDRAPLYPIRRLAKLTNAIAPLLVDHPDYAGMRDALDTRIHERFQSDTTISRRDRGHALLSAGRPLAALTEFHRVRQAWYVKDTMRGAILSSLLIARCYEELGLPAASKMFLLSAAHNAIADGSSDLIDLIPKALFLAAQSDYGNGAWMGAVELTEAAILLYDQLGAAPWQKEDLNYDSNFMMLFAPYGLARAYRPLAVTPLASALDRAGVLAVAGTGPGPWTDVTESAAAIELAANGFLPFVDCGPRRTMTSRALGLDISVTFDNDYETSLAGERFLAMLEVTAAAVAAEGLTVAQGEIAIELSIVDDLNATDVEQVASPDNGAWRVAIPYGIAARDVIMATGGAALGVLQSAIVTTDDAARAHVLAHVLDRVAPTILTIGGTYDSFLSGFVPKDRWKNSCREEITPLAGGILSPAPSHPEMS